MWHARTHARSLVGANLRGDNLQLLHGIPIDMFVGDCDELGFCPTMMAIHAELGKLAHKPEATLTVLPGAGHMDIGQHVAMDEFWRLMERRRRV